MKTVFFLIFFLLVFAINAYVMWRGAQALSSFCIARSIWWVVMVLLFLSMFAGMIFGSVLPPFLGKFISTIGYTYMIVFIYLFLSFLLIDGIRLVNHFVHVAPPGMFVFRMWALALTAFLMVVVLTIGNIKFNKPEVVRLQLKVEGRSLEGKTVRIVAVSDMHLGVMTDKSQLKKYVAMINSQHPDVVMMAGDVSDRETAPLIRQHMDEEIRQIKAPMGVFAINGNHEHYAETPNSTAEFLTGAGVKVLRDEVALVNNSFYVIGRHDRSHSGRKNLSDLVRGLDPSKPKILLDHQPIHLEEAEQSGIDLQISGHTHRGQIFPGNLLVKRMYELDYGYKKKGHTHYYVSSGISLWGPPFRIGTQSELVVIDFEY